MARHVSARRYVLPVLAKHTNKQVDLVKNVNIRQRSTRDEDRFSYLADRGYWEQFYRGKGAPAHFEWLTSYRTILDHLHLPQAPFKLLDVGCGVSRFTPKLVKDTPHLHTACCVDFSLDAIKTLLAQEEQIGDEARSRIFGVVADAKCLPFEKASFDMVFDKGTTDSVLKGENGVQEASAILSECLRVLTPGGVLVQITDEDPDLRSALLEGISQKPININFSVLQEGDAQEYFLYRIKEL